MPINDADVVEYVKVSQLAIKKLAAEVDSLRSAEKRAAAEADGLVAQAVAALEKAGHIRAEHRPHATAAFATRKGLLETMIKFAARAVPARLAQAPEPIGIPVATPSKQASAGSPAGPSESDRHFVERMLSIRRP